MAVAKTLLNGSWGKVTINSGGNFQKELVGTSFGKIQETLESFEEDKI